MSPPNFLTTRVRSDPIHRSYWLVEVMLYEGKWSIMRQYLNLYEAVRISNWLNGTTPRTNAAASTP